MAPIESVVPLRALEPRSIRSWKQWLELWSEHSEFEFLHGLLHHGFEVPYGLDETRPQRVCFYLETADGYRSGHNFDAPRVNAGNKSLTEDKDHAELEEKRQELAQKAFKVVAHQLFRPREDRDVNTTWYLLSDPGVFEKVLWFFRPGSRNYHRRGNTQERWAWEFVRKLTRIAWGSYRDMYEISDNIRGSLIPLLKDAQPRLVPVLAELDDLAWLVRGPEVGLSPAVLAELEKLALEEKESFPDGPGMNRRKPASLEEAWYGGSQAAMVLLLNQVRQREAERLRELAELKKAERDENERQRKRAELEQERDKIDAKIEELGGRSE